MRRWTAVFLSLILTVAFTACESGTALQQTTENTQPVKVEDSLQEEPSAADSETEETSEQSATDGAEETAAEQSEESKTEEAGLRLSEMMVSISTQGKTATFQLYDTEAAAAFYEQLPLELELSNFRDAQWMFYPPEKLPVTGQEAYHDGKKGELSYYEPWGDVFMLYKDFYAQDEMHRLGIGLTGIEEIAGMSGNVRIEKEEQTSQEETEMKMKLQIGEKVFTATLADNSSVDALRELLAEGPLTLTMSDYAGMEKGADLGKALPQNNVQMNTQAGDIILYQGRTFVIYYNTNSWSLTPIGKIDDVDATQLRQALGTGNVTVTISIE